ncbi:MAG TPA: GntR family transcriptional regulator [Armatimonadota bacterium]|nr:GntR family transcriptional regulator [Armatimonadota bacterium]
MEQRILRNEKPVYRQVEEDLRMRIAHGEWPVGSMLPGRKTLAKSYDIDLRTLQHAIAALLDDGTLQASDRRGTFVANVPTVDSIGITSNFPPQETSIHPSITNTVSHKPRRIGIIAPCGLSEDLAENDEPRSPWVYALLTMLEAECSKSGDVSCFGDLLQTNSYTLNPPAQVIQHLVTEGIDGLIVIDIHDDSGYYTSVAQTPGVENLPVAYIACRDILGPFPHVFYDNRYAGYQATEHLLHLGYRELLYFAPVTANWVTDRWLGACAAVEQIGQSATIQRFPKINVPEHKKVQDSEEVQLIDSYTEQVVQLLINRQSLVNRPGIIATNDESAYSVIECAQRHGLTVGQDYCIIGFDDRRRSRLYGLTSLRPPLEGLATTALHLMNGMLQNDAIPHQIRLTSQLVNRASTRELFDETSTVLP